MTTAVEIRCPNGHLVATLHPFPARGRATHLEIRPRPARYRAEIADYVANDDRHGAGWVTVPAREQHRFTIEEFGQFDEWAHSATWACRCGLGQLDAGRVVDAAWAWSADRAGISGNKPPRVVTLSRRTSMP